MNKIKKRNPEKRSKEKSSLCNIEMFYRAQQVIINFYRDYSLLASKTKDVAKHVEGLKILAPKQMLQRLIITLAKVKLENTSVYETRSDKLFTFCIDQKKLLRRYKTT